jgi:hypothetical protein
MDIGKETRFITKLFRNTEVKIPFHTNNTINSHFPHNNNNKIKMTTANQKYIN